MADLIELDLVVRDKGLKQSLTTVERLERQIIKAAKAVDQNRISQDRYNKVLLQAKREYQALGVSSQKATASVRRFAESQRDSGVLVNNTTSAIKRQAAAQMAATKSSNRLGVVTQQAGYQVSDFVVQVQSGTNAFVAFGQQASQLVGVLPLIAGSLGLTAGAAIGLSAGLGIIIPLLTAIGAALTRGKDKTDDLTDSLKELEAATKSTKEEVELFNSLFDDISQKRVSDEINKISEEMGALDKRIQAINKSALVGFGASAGIMSAEELQKLVQAGADAQTESLREQRKLLQDKYNARVAELGIMKGQERSSERQTDYLQQMVNLFRDVTAGRQAVARSQTTLNAETEEYLKSMAAAFNKAQALKEELGEGAYEALRLANVDMKSGIDAAALSAARLAADLNISLAAAMAMQRMAASEELVMSQPVVTGSTTDRFGVKDLLNMGYTREYLIAIGKIREETKKLGSTTKKTMSDAEKAALDYAKSLDNQVIGAIGGVADAWGDFVVRGFNDFKGFVSSVLDSFKSMIANMIAMAAKNKIMLSLGIGGVGSGSVASAAGSIGGTAGNSILSGGGMLSGTAVGAGISAIGTGLSSGFMSSVYGGLGGMSGAISGGLSVGGLGGIATSIGAIAAPLLAVAAVFSFFKKKTKELDSGLQGTITTLDATIESFKTLETKRFWGLSKKVSTEAEALDKEAAEPLLEAIRGIQQGVMDAADMFGIASDVFDKFSYEFKLSLKGLSEDEQIQKVNEELAKMGDSFASLTGHFETMNELLAAAQQRYDLTTRLLQLQGNAEELLRRQREAEMAATHDMNKELLQSIYTLEDAAIAVNNAEVALSEANAAYEESTRVFESALSDLRRLMDEEAAAAQRAVDSAYDSLKGAMESAMDAAIDAVDSARGSLRDAMDRAMGAAIAAVDSAQADLERAVGARVEGINKSFDSILDNLNYKLDVASQKANASRDIFELLDSSLRGRRVTSESTSFASRQQALSYVSSGGTDMDKLSDALGVLNEPSEKFFGTFQEYARDFAVTSNAIKGSRDAAEATMSADERAVVLLEDQISQNEVARDLQIQQVEALLGTEEAVLSVEEALIAVEKALADKTTLENQHKELVAQFPLLSEDVVSVADATKALTEALAHKDVIVSQHKELVAQFPLLSEDVVSVADATKALTEALAHKDVIAAQHSELVAQFPMLNQSVLSIGQAINNLASAQAAQAAAAKAQADAQAAVIAAQQAQAQASANATEALSKVYKETEKTVVSEVEESLPKLPKLAITHRSTSEADFYKVGDRTFNLLKNATNYLESENSIRGYAQGGMHSGGLRMVGERGPELEATGPSRIFSHNQTASMFRDPDLREAVRDLKEEVSGLRSEQRQIQMGISKYTKRSYDIERKWDVDGLPATRT